MASSKTMAISELVESHKPKNFKYKYIMKDDTIYDQLLADSYDIDSLDTINDDMLVQEALKAEYKEYQREVVAKAKVPTVLDMGVIVSKKMVTKADKKLLCVKVGFFDYDNLHYVSIKLCYEKFDIIEIFILT